MTFLDRALAKVGLQRTPTPRPPFTVHNGYVDLHLLDGVDQAFINHMDRLTARH